MEGLIADGIGKNFGKTRALEYISFRIGNGELFGLIGPDGAGKTTLLRILATLLLPDAGSASLDGLDTVRDFRRIRRLTGYMPGRFSLYQDLTVEENLVFYATVFGTTLQRNYDLIRDIYVRLEPFKNRRAGRLSGGMKQKLALCCALIHKPRLLILDEPTGGVDAVSRQEFWDLLRRLRASGMTIIVSTPYMDEAGLCDRVGLIQGGRMLRIDSPAAISDGFAGELVAVRNGDPYRLLLDLGDYPYTERVYPFGEYLHYTDRRQHVPLQELADFIRSRGHEDVEMKLTQPTIEDCFIALMTQPDPHDLTIRH